MHGKRFSTLLLVVMLLGAPTAARAMTFTVIGGAADLSLFCTDVLCFTQTLTQSDGGSASGSITLNAGLVDIDVTLTVLSFSGTDGTVTGVSFTTLNLVATGLTQVGPDDDFSAAGSGTASATQSESGAGAGANAFSATTPLLSLICDETAPSVLKCGLTANAMLFPVSIGTNPDQRYASVIIDMTAVPEPSSSVMAVTAGLMGLTYARRKRIR